MAQVATNLVAKLLALEAMNNEKDIKIYMNCGGKHTPGLIPPCWPLLQILGQRAPPLLIKHRHPYNCRRVCGCAAVSDECSRPTQPFGRWVCSWKFWDCGHPQVQDADPLKCLQRPKQFCRWVCLRNHRNPGHSQIHEASSQHHLPGAVRQHSHPPVGTQQSRTASTRCCW